MSKQMTDFKIHRNLSGRLILTDAEGIVHEGVVPVHAFPISAPEQGLALVDSEGHELIWIDQLSVLPEEIRLLLQEELDNREFIPEILKILHVSTFATPSLWEVETNRGATTLTLKAEEDIRRLEQNTLLIADSQGIHFLIRDVQQLDKGSRKILDRFL